jgi:hypothetical protein
VRERNERHRNDVCPHGWQRNFRFDQTDDTHTAVKDKLVHQVVARLVRVIRRIMVVLVIATGAFRNVAVMRVGMRDIQGCTDKEPPQEHRSYGKETRHGRRNNTFNAVRRGLNRRTGFPHDQSRTKQPWTSSVKDALSRPRRACTKKKEPHLSQGAAQPSGKAD